MRFLTMDTRAADDAAIANGAGVLFILVALVYGVLVLAETRYADSASGSIISLSADDLPFIENGTYSQLSSACRSNGADKLNNLVGRNRYDNETMSTRVCSYDSGVANPD